MHPASARGRHPMSRVLLMALALVASDAIADEYELSLSAMSEWLDSYGKAWETRNANAAAEIFTEDATYRVTPYEEPHVGKDAVREYWAGVTENQRNVQFEHQALSVKGDTGIAHWSASFDVAPDGTKVGLDGIFVLEFADDGKCRRLREWWHLKGDGAEGQN
jgi:uncharacterized protein (TIGR02246 family)